VPTKLTAKQAAAELGRLCDLYGYPTWFREKVREKYGGNHANSFILLAVIKGLEDGLVQIRIPKKRGPVPTRGPALFRDVELAKLVLRERGNRPTLEAAIRLLQEEGGWHLSGKRVIRRQWASFDPRKMADDYYKARKAWRANALAWAKFGLPPLPPS
jgi:hypothetical protein